jgi:hypothetical protein
MNTELLAKLESFKDPKALKDQLDVCREVSNNVVCSCLFSDWLVSLFT